LPPEALCFSVVTSSRSLDLAAETLEDAIMWKTAIRELIAMLASGTPDWSTDAAVKGASRVPAWREYLRKSGADDRKERCTTSNDDDEEEEEDEASDEDEDEEEEALHQSSPVQEEADDDPESNSSYKTASIAARKSSLRDKLFAAIEGAEYATVERILFTGIVDASAYDANRQCTPLMSACKNGLADIAKLCVQFGGKVDTKSDSGHTALHYAAECGSIECAQVILKAAKQQKVGAVLANVKNDDGKTPFLICTEYGEMALIKLLLASGADLTAADKKKKCCLHLSASYGHDACLALLLDSGADGMLEAQDILGNTALHYSAKYGHLESTQLLLETASNALVRNKNGRTPYDLAGEQGFEEVCSLLYEYMNSTPLASPQKRQYSSPAKRGKVSFNSPIDTSSRAHSQTGHPASSMFEGILHLHLTQWQYLLS
jgi:ankyrin repeat protein